MRGHLLQVPGKLKCFENLWLIGKEIAREQSSQKRPANGNKDAE